MTNWILYSTDGCHLCDEALALLAKEEVSVQVLDIMDSPDWLEAYKVRIPVLKHTHKQQELDWPFDAMELRDFIEAVSGTH